MTRLLCAPEQKNTRIETCLPATLGLLYFHGNKSVVHDQRSMAAHSVFTLALSLGFKGKDAVFFHQTVTIDF